MFFDGVVADQSAGTFVVAHGFPSGELEAAWRDCLRRVAFPAHYNAPEFFLSPLWDVKRPFAVLALQAGRVVGILTGIHDGRQLKCGLSTRPQICVDATADSTAETALAEGLAVEAGDEPLLVVHSWTLLNEFLRLGYRHRRLEGNVVLDLTKGPDALFKESHVSRRRNVRFAIRQGVEVSQAFATQEIQEYYDVYIAWRKTQRKQITGAVQSLESFMRARALTENSRLFVARYKGKIIGGHVVRFLPHGLLESAGNASLDAFLDLKPNDLLHWKTIEWGCKEGFQRYSLGGAQPFHRRDGGIVVPIHRYRLDRSWLKRYDMREAVLDFARENIPSPIGKLVRRILRKAG